ncbi:ATP-binding cassette domain-containing protein [Rhizobiaceae bacterium BDR2-2]|uniref:ATP-binding cassette domain-containing protein n=1 Tax=Ectorhizobium quercum TaxID=2965071 RepID=A0AAE3MZG4_9HYPH|nr:ATP-binding cassette domain-containing protein [Ectorhizobium quercum]MCX8997301.1 ATP-binding cassette domain-containing protein [Ectorhizobium quercum]
MSAVSTPLVSVRNLVKQYDGRKKLFGGAGFSLRAVDDVSFDIAPGETLGLVGESGSGKSTTGRVLLQLEPPTSGEVLFKGETISGLKSSRMKRFRREMQIVFQDPYSALDPRMTVGDFVAEPILVHESLSSAERRERAAGLFRLVGLDPSFMSRYPHEFSGGQRQRINIARAVALRPSFIVADEPITALDVSIQAQIINLFQDLQEEMGLAYLFVAHDLSMVRYLCHRVAVMLRGRIVEIAPAEALFEDARHPYTQALLTAIPVPDPRIERQRRHRPFDLSVHGPKPGQELREVGPNHFVLS